MGLQNSREKLFLFAPTTRNTDQIGASPTNSQHNLHALKSVP
jgi:hypothetical protein